MASVSSECPRTKLAWQKRLKIWNQRRGDTIKAKDELLKRRLTKKINRETCASISKKWTIGKTRQRTSSGSAKLGGTPSKNLESKDKDQTKAHKGRMARKGSTCTGHSQWSSASGVHLAFSAAGMFNGQYDGLPYRRLTRWGIPVPSEGRCSRNIAKEINKRAPTALT